MPPVFDYELYRFEIEDSDDNRPIWGNVYERDGKKYVTIVRSQTIHQVYPLSVLIKLGKLLDAQD